MDRKWNPAHHPRDKRGRFTRSATRVMTAAERKRGKSALDGFQPQPFKDAGAAHTYLEKINHVGADDDPIGKYFGGDWKTINAGLRAGENPDGVAEIDKAMTALPDDVMLRRQVPLAMFAHIPLKDLEGMKVRDAAYASTSLDTPGSSNKAPDMVTMHIAAPAGTNAIVNADDDEVLLARDTEIAISRAEPNGRGGWDLYGTVIPKTAAKATKDDQGKRPDAEKPTPKKPAPKKPTPDKATPEKAAADDQAPVPEDKARAVDAAKKAYTETLAQQVESLRAGMPQTRSDWETSVTRQGAYSNAVDRLNDTRARREAAQQNLEKRRAEVSAAIKAYDPKKRKARIDKETDALLAREIDNVAWYDGLITDEEDRLKTMTPDRGYLAYPRDTSGRDSMPSEDMNRHLDSVLEVGSAAMGHLRQAFADDPELARITREADAPPAPDAALLDFRRGQRRLKRERAAREQQIVTDYLGNARPFGGVHHDNAVTAPAGADAADHEARDDWDARLSIAEQHFPADWLTTSAGQPLSVKSSDRAHYSPTHNQLAMSIYNPDMPYTGGFAEYNDEVTTHELGHRMEQYIPGLTHLEFAFTRRRSTQPDGSVEPNVSMRKLQPGGGYEDYEIAKPDEWAEPYAGKTYETFSSNPGRAPWEVFQVGLQDLFGRGDRVYDRTDELQAFTLGALLLLPGTPDVEPTDLPGG